MPVSDLPPLKALRAFEAVARRQSVTGAAAELHVTHGAVSRQLQVLEHALGRPLFARSGRGLKLTEAGIQLHEAAGPVLDQLRQTWRTLKSPSPDAALVLGCPGSLLARWLIPRLEKLGHDLPALSVHLAAREEPLDPSLRGLDAALLLAAPPWPTGWQVIELASERTGPVVSPHYAGWSRLQGREVDVLVDEPVLGTRSRPQAWPHWAQAHDLELAQSGAGAQFPHLYHLLEAAIAGLGVAIAPAPLVADDLATGRLLAPWGFHATGGCWILARLRHTADARFDALAQWLERELDGG